MSGFFGLLHRRGQALEDTLCEQLLAAQAYRGGDQSGYWRDAGTALGHSLLTTTPQLAREPQPFRHLQSGTVISADVRLDNRSELAAALGLHSADLRNSGDAQLILEAWHRWGENCPQYLLGDFAFTLWDPHQQRLFGARDHLGVKPFYYHLDARLCMTASDTATLLRHPLVANDLNDQRIADFFFDDMEAADLSSTLYKSLQRLPPGHTISIGNDSSSVKRYWQAEANHQEFSGGADAGVEEFISVLERAVACRSTGDRGVGILLSGGVDSALVTSIAKRLSNSQPLLAPQTYSGITRQHPCSETIAIKQLNHQLQLEPAYLQLEHAKRDDYASLLAAWAHCEPFDKSMTMLHRLYASGAAQRQRVMLDGVEGDMVHSLMTNYPATLLRQGHWPAAWRESAGLQRNHFNRQISLPRVLRQSMLPGLVPTSLRRLRRRLTGSQRADALIADSMINPDFARETDCRERLQQFHEQHSPGPAATTAALHCQSINHPFLAVALERYDRVAASHGVEARHPLLDKRLIELSQSLPWQHKRDRGQAKVQLRRAAQRCGVTAANAWSHTSQHLGWQFTAQANQLLNEEISASCQRMRPLLARYVSADKLEHEQLEESERWQLFGLARWLERH